MDIKHPTNIHETPGALIMRDDGVFNKFGFRWRVGRSWGLAHSDDICYADGDVVQVFDKEIRLGLEYKPAYFDVDQKKLYQWGVGYVSTIEPIKYGTLKVKFILPRGGNLWPAIWTFDCETWPPEIDIVEAWSNTKYDNSKCYRRVWKGITIPFTNDIFPSLHLGNNPDNHYSKSYRNLFKGSCSCELDTDFGENECELIWTPEYIDIYWNGKRIVKEEDPDILKWFNEGKGQCIQLNNYVTNDFKECDFVGLKDNEESYLRITGLSYTPL